MNTLVGLHDGAVNAILERLGSGWLLRSPLAIRIRLLLHSMRVFVRAARIGTLGRHGEVALLIDSVVTEQVRQLRTERRGLLALKRLVADRSGRGVLTKVLAYQLMDSSKAPLVMELLELLRSEEDDELRRMSIRVARAWLELTTQKDANHTSAISALVAEDASRLSDPAVTGRAVLAVLAENPCSERRIRAVLKSIEVQDVLFDPPWVAQTVIRDAAERVSPEKLRLQLISTLLRLQRLDASMVALAMEVAYGRSIAELVDSDTGLQVQLAHVRLDVFSSAVNWMLTSPSASIPRLEFLESAIYVSQRGSEIPQMVANAILERVPESLWRELYDDLRYDLVHIYELTDRELDALDLRLTGMEVQEVPVAR